MRNYPLRTDNPNALIKLDDAYKLANAAFYDGYIVGRLRNKKKIDAITLNKRIKFMFEAIAFFPKGDDYDGQDKT